MWSVLFNSTRNSMQYFRQVDDKWNSAAGGFAAGLIANIRGSISLGISQGLQYAMLFYFLSSIGDYADSSRKKEVEGK